VIKFTTALLIGFISFSAPVFSQDSAFIDNYKEFRSLVDSLQTFSVYIVPDNSSRLHQINSSVDYFKNAYHFLRKKKAVKNNPDFVVVILVDSLLLEQSSELVTSNDSPENYFHWEKKQDSRGTGYTVSRRYYYKITFNMIIETKEKIAHCPPVVINEKLISPMALGTDDKSVSFLQRQLEFVLEKYKNYYIDRVDW
jgi:hypothetical protein